MCVMKLNKYFMMGAMGLSLVACSDNLDDNQGVNGNTSNEGTTYVAFGLDFKAAGSRAEEVGDSWESDVNSAYVIMDNSVIISMDNTDTGDDNGYYDATSKKFLFHTEPGEHTFLAVVNPDTPPTAGESGNLNTYFTASVATTPTVVASVTQEGQEKKGNFMMSSVEEKTFYINDNVTEERALQGTDESTNSYKIEVERVSAKVTVTAADATIESAEGTEAGGTIENTVFNLMQGADNMTRMRGSVLGTNTYIWKVPNVAVTTGQTYNQATPAYCLENIHNANGYVQTNTTYITLKTTFTPSKVVNAQGKVVNYTYKKGDNKTFYVVTEGSLAGNYIMGDATTGTAPSPLPAGVDDISEAYEDGECWFGPIWFGQETPNVSADAPVVRNTWYNLAITKITLPGSPDEPRPIPDEKLEPATNVAITLSIVDWDFKNIPVDLQ